MNLFRFACFLSFIVLSLASTDQQHSWSHHAYLDPHEKYFLQWKFNDAQREITFQVEVETLGWIGFGLTASGGMKGSDMIIGWVEDSGRAFFHVR